MYGIYHVPYVNHFLYHPKGKYFFKNQITIIFLVATAGICVSNTYSSYLCHTTCYGQAWQVHGCARSGR